jgi:hypothetical protein
LEEQAFPDPRMVVFAYQLVVQALDLQVVQQEAYRLGLCHRL